jgi:hypothetical protein
MVMKIATGEIPDNSKAISGKVRSGRAGAKARAKKLSKKEERIKIAKKAASTRWGRSDG